MTKPYKVIKPMFQSNRWRIFPGDLVLVRSGVCKGQTGKVLAVIKDKRVPQVIVEGVNLRKRILQGGRDSSSSFVVTMEAPIHYSQVNLLEPVIKDSDDKTVADPLAMRTAEQRWVRAKFRFLEDGSKVRVGKHYKNATGTLIPIPDVGDTTSKLGVGGPKDTVAEEVVRDTRAADTEDFTSFLSRHSWRPSTLASTAASAAASAPASAAAGAASSVRTYSCGSAASHWCTCRHPPCPLHVAGQRCTGLLAGQASVLRGLPGVSGANSTTLLSGFAVQGWLARQEWL